MDLQLQKATDSLTGLQPVCSWRASEEFVEKRIKIISGSILLIVL